MVHLAKCSKGAVMTVISKDRNIIQKSKFDLTRALSDAMFWQKNIQV
jgi:hypothetical protein